MAYQQVRLSRSCRFIRSIVVVAAAADAAVVSVCFSDALLIDPVKLRKTRKEKERKECIPFFAFLSSLFFGVCGGH